MKVAVSRRALIQRINRRLIHSDELLRVARGERAQFDLGEYYVIDIRLNAVVAEHVDLEALARDIDAIQPWEELVD